MTDQPTYLQRETVWLARMRRYAHDLGPDLVADDTWPWLRQQALRVLYEADDPPRDPERPDMWAMRALARLVASDVLRTADQMGGRS